MSFHHKFSRAQWIYFTAVIGAGLSVTANSAVYLYFNPAPSEWLILAALTLLTGSFTLRMTKLAIRISVSDAFVFAAVLLFGTEVGTVIVAVDSIVATLLMRREHRSVLRSLYNLSVASLSLWSAATIFFWLVGALPNQSDLVLTPLLWPLFVLAGVYFIVNSWLIAIVISFEQGDEVWQIWWQHFPWFSLNYFGGVSAAALLVSYTRTVDIGAISIILPLLVISYLSYRTSLARVQDAQQHVQQLNSLYISTIETLAMAVDAKDQITHGHIRRVQVYAVELAKRLGVRAESHLRAIEAAALLHDMGKLAIPEHILNKPGKLTATEFDRMKRHAAIGADLLSSIRFPYPVVPIVRHHHENWDGQGYPSGISGTDIPLGARILSVVDCFDALTSDRPYRPRLSTEDAFRVLRERRGSMYDPLVVDMFISSHSQIAALAIRAGVDARSITEASGESDSSNQVALHEISVNASESAVLNECVTAIAATTPIRERIDIAFQALRQVTPISTCAFYRYEPADDCIVCDVSIGDDDHLLPGIRIRLGERVSGWTAANRQASTNSDASLDLQQLADLFNPPLKSTIAVPLVRGDRLAGVFAGYSIRSDVFSDNHRYAVERVASALIDRGGTAGAENHKLVHFPSPKPL